MERQERGLQQSSAQAFCTPVPQTQLCHSGGDITEPARVGLGDTPSREVPPGSPVHAPAPLCSAGQPLATGPSALCGAPALSCSLQLLASVLPLSPDGSQPSQLSLSSLCSGGLQGASARRHLSSVAGGCAFLFCTGTCHKERPPCLDLAGDDTEQGTGGARGPA